MKPIRYTVLIVEDDESMRDTLEAILKKEYRIIQAESGKEALKKLGENEIQIALIDIRLPDIRGTEILKAIKRERPDIECIMMSVISDDETAAECFKNGALDYFTKEFDYDILHQRIKNAASLYHKKMLLRHYRRKLQTLESELSLLRKEAPSPSQPMHRFKGRSDEGDCSLTEREIGILRLKANGLKNKAVADKLSISAETVRTHVYNILHKLNVKSISHATALAYEKGILKLPKED
ncbi:MAG: response regulator transcription factor [Nitrospinae bacterium]|nr:response regulator transcription factor [Nitrospinota bacterium]